MSDLGDTLNMHGDLHKAKRKLFGVNCPECVRLLPRANPSILLPGQRCRIHNYRDSRPELSDAQCEQIAQSLGWTYTKEPQRPHRLDGRCFAFGLRGPGAMNPMPIELDEEAERVAFEAEHLEMHLGRRVDGSYKSYAARVMFRAWLAAKRHAAKVTE